MFPYWCPKIGEQSVHNLPMKMIDVEIGCDW